MILTEQKNATNYNIINVQLEMYFKIIYIHQLSDLYQILAHYFRLC